MQPGFQGVERMVPSLSEAARALLLEASRDPAGLIIRVTSEQGTKLLKSNGRIFVDGSPRGQTSWDDGLRQLFRLGLIESWGNRGLVYCITPEGGQAADALRNRH